MLALTHCLILASSTFTAAGTGTIQVAYLKASNTDRWDQFGVRIAISGNTAVVGAYSEDSQATGVGGDEADNSANNAGAVYVFVHDSDGWSQQAYLKASNTGRPDRFGSSVAISGDTLVVGAQLESSGADGVNGNQASNSARFAGAAYVFVRSGTQWSQQAYLKPSNTSTGASPLGASFFGASVAICNDTIVVGRPGEASAATGVNGNQVDNSSPYAGAAYVFIRNGTNWTQQAYLKASNTDPSAPVLNDEGFGGAVSISGDTVAVGAWGEDTDATGINPEPANEEAQRSGAVYVFVRDRDQWSHQAYIKASNTREHARFGNSVSVSGDTLAVGSYGESSASTGVNGDQADTSTPNSGAAYVFTRTETSWSQQAYLKASNTELSDGFGFSVSITGDTLVVGAWNEASNATGVDGDQADNQAHGAGAAYVFVRDVASWTQETYLKASNSDSHAHFGGGVAISGSTMLVGARSEGSAATGVDGDQSDDSNNYSGAAYVFETPAIATTFCTALPNATGYPAELSATGLAGFNLVLLGGPVPMTAGLFFFSASTQPDIPFGDGRLCLTGALQRLGLPIRPPAGGNEARLAIDNSAPYAVGLAGTQHFQYWFRSDLTTGSGFNLSDALSIDF